MVNNIKYFIVKSFILLKIFLANLFKIRIEGELPKLRPPMPTSIQVRSSRRKLRALEASLKRNPEAFTHLNYLNMLMLRSTMHSNQSQTNELQKDLDEIIKVCIDWKSRYKGEQ